MAVETDSTQDTDSRNTAQQILNEATLVTVLTGAGISTDSGIPDFRGPDGVWTKNPTAEKASNIHHYVAEPEVRKANWEQRASGEMWADAEPNDGHRALVMLEEQGKLHTLITQNVDELHQRAGSSPDKVVEIHGTTRKVGCLDCEWRAEMTIVLDRVRAGEADPHCEVCGGILKSATISFGQSLVAADLRRAEVAASECDVFLAVGSSLAVFPINESVALAKNSGAGLIIVNMEPTPYDHYADVVLRESISDVLPMIVRIPD